jgi:hypothetical protein
VDKYGAMDIVYKKDDLSRKYVDSNSLLYKGLCMFYPLKRSTATTTIIYINRGERRHEVHL